MQDLDSFISPIPGFEGDILIPAIPILTHNPSIESFQDTPARSSAGNPKTREGNRRAPIDPSPQKKGQEILRKN
jgi:hypothetical protein